MSVSYLSYRASGKIWTYSSKEKELSFLAYHDILTGFKNKNSLQKMLKTDIRQYVLLLLNVDNFSYVNTAFGCDAGDVILIEISKMLKKLCNHEFLYRINADEFGIVYKEDIDIVTLIEKIQNYFVSVKKPEPLIK